MSKKRVAIYIDGFNYYYAIIDYIRRYSFTGSLKWLNYKDLIQKKILQKISYEKSNLKINFYTAINTYRPKDSQNRHERYLKVLEKSGVNVIRGKYKLREVYLSCHLNCGNCKKITYLHDYKLSKDIDAKCSHCNQSLDLSSYTTTQHPEEKQTDVNIAKDILIDALKDKVDLFYIFSTDSDFVPVVNYIVNELKKEVVIVAPQTSENGEFRYKIENFTNLGAQEYRLKLGTLANYQFSQTSFGMTKPENW